MPANTLITPSVVKLKADVRDAIYNFSPSDAPLVSILEREDVHNPYIEWQRDTYRAANAANAAIEGADAIYAAQTQPTLLNNRTQIFQDTVSVSNTAQASGKYGRKDEAKRLRRKKMVELKKDMDLAFISSGATVTGTSGVAARCRGLYGFITNMAVGASGAAPNPVTNTAPVNGTDAAISETTFKAQIRTAYENGGSASIILCSPAKKVAISGFTGNVQRTNEVGTKAPAVLNAAFDFYRSDFGVHKVVPDRNMVTGVGAADTIYFIDPDKLAIGELRGFEEEKLATTGDAENWQVRTEVTLIVRDEKPLAAYTDIT